MSGLFPAHEVGEFGRVIVGRSGHFEFEKRPGIPLKFMSFSSGGEFLPLFIKDTDIKDHKDAEAFAEQVARNGYNMIRIWVNNLRVFSWEKLNAEELDPSYVDRHDYLMWQLKKRGIYVYLSVACETYGFDNCYPWGDDLRNKHDWSIYRNERDYRSWEECTEKVLTHVNPYTKMRWADDPVFFCLNLVNENPLILKWNTGGEKEILRLYREWLRSKKLDTAENRNAREGVFFQFLTEYQNRTILWMKEFVRKEIGSKTLITDLNCGGPNGPNPYLTRSRTLLDLVDQHTYNDHPMILETWNPPVLFKQKSLIPGGVGISALRMFGKPFLVSEYGFCHPNRYIAEHGPVMGAYAALQDWDGMIYFQYAWSHRIVRMESEYTAWSGYFDTLSNPVKRLSDYIVWFLFIRGDVRPAETGAAIGLNDLPWTQAGNVTRELMRLGKIERIGVLPENRNMKNVRRVRPSSIPAPGKVSVSSTKEVISDNTLPEMKVITPKSECITTEKVSAAANLLSFRNGTATRSDRLGARCRGEGVSYRQIAICG